MKPAQPLYLMDKKPRFSKTGPAPLIAAAAVALIAAAGLVIASRGGKVMPLNETAVVRYQDAASKVMTGMLNHHKGESLQLQTALAFRFALRHNGYDPEKSIAYWLSDEFQQDLASGPAGEAAEKRARADQLIGIALGDGTDEAEFEKIIRLYGDDVTSQAVARRNR